MSRMPDNRAFYDQDGVLDTYLEVRQWVDNPNATIERPTFYELAGDLSGLDIIDLGCGYGDFGSEALGAGARSYTGVEMSQKMAERARQTLAGTGAHVEQQRLEDWQHSCEPVDLVTARLVLHYVEDLAPVLTNVVASLRTGGHFIFSVEHPVLTSSPPRRKSLDPSRPRHLMKHRRLGKRGLSSKACGTRSFEQRRNLLGR
jgi:2-polyprenyl-3-methyl-5-hydroxy-6-metoxy-1,4-benzoquinol methylase